VGLGRERLAALTGLGTATPTLTAVPTAATAPTETPTPTATLMSTETPAPTATLTPAPLPAVGGGTGILGFNANNLGYTVDVSCVLAGGAGEAAVTRLSMLGSVEQRGNTDRWTIVPPQWQP